MAPDERAIRGFGSAAEDYEAGRPSYPPALVAALAPGPGATVLDLGAGTGKLTRLLAGRHARVLAVEPVPAMRERLARAVPAATILDGTAEAIPVPDASVDAVFVAEAMHWFLIELAAAEIARILVPGGDLVVLRNVPTWSEETTPWLGELRAVLDPIRRAAPGYPAAGDDWRTRLEATRRFTPFEQEWATHAQALAAEAFVAQAASWSWIATLPGEERRALLDRVRALAERHAPIVVPYRAEAFRARRRA